MNDVKINPYNYIKPSELPFPVQINRVGFTNSFNIVTDGDYQYTLMPKENFSPNKTMTGNFGTNILAIKDNLGRIYFNKFVLALEIDCHNFNGKLGQYLIDNQVFALQHLHCLGSDFE
jgi:hypothetical protein